MRSPIALFAILLLAGCTSTSDQESFAASEARAMKRMSNRYDLDAVRSYLQAVIAKHPTFEGVDLELSSCDAEWKVERIVPPIRVRCGDWVLWDVAQTNEEFNLDFEYDQKNGKIVSIRSRRLTDDRFLMIAITLDDFVELIE